MGIRLDMNDFRLPIEVDYDKEYAPKLDDTLDNYLNYIKENDKLKNFYPKIEKNCKLIKGVLDLYYSGKIVDALNGIISLLKDYKGDRFFVSDINNSYAFRASSPDNLQPKEYSDKYKEKYDVMKDDDIYFFRARSNDKALNNSELYHIPLDNRGIIGNERFSISGIPCLYLSTTSWCTWKELDEPCYYRFQVSSFKMPSTINVINLCVTQYLINGIINGNEEEESRGIACLEIFPLIIATSFVVKQRDRLFKSEYIISQLIMLACEKLEIDGVAYLSKKIKDAYAYPQAVNFAIIIPKNNGNKYWSKTNEVKMTCPVRASELIENNFKVDEKRTFIAKYFKEGFNNKISNEQNYSDSFFCNLDEYLVRKEFKEMKNGEMCNGDK